MGLGLWSSVGLSMGLEGLIFGAGLLVYLRTTRAADRIGSWGLWSMVAVLVLFFVAAALGPPPPNPRALALSSLGLWLFVPWSWWVDRHRAGAILGGALPTLSLERVEDP